MRDLYEMEYGIYPHANPKFKRPLSSVELHPAEELIENSLLEEIVQNYIQKKIGDIYKLSLTEFLDLPPHVVKLLIKLSDSEISKQNNAVNLIDSELSKMSK